MSAERKSLPPEFALAYILTDWRKNRAVSKAYNASSVGEEDADELVAEALRKLRVYVTALEDALAAHPSESVKEMEKKESERRYVAPRYCDEATDSGHSSASGLDSR